MLCWTELVLSCLLDWDCVVLHWAVLGWVSVLCCVVLYWLGLFVLCYVGVIAELCLLDWVGLC